MGGQKGWGEEKVKRNEREGVVVLVVGGGIYLKLCKHVIQLMNIFISFQYIQM